TIDVDKLKARAARFGETTAKMLTTVSCVRPGVAAWGVLTGLRMVVEEIKVM
ncbi:hypothetical protein FHG87_025142, partial [Trinorchestia longiramus]